MVYLLWLQMKQHHQLHWLGTLNPVQSPAAMLEPLMFTRRGTILPVANKVLTNPQRLVKTACRTWMAASVTLGLAATLKTILSAFGWLDSHTATASTLI